MNNSIITQYKIDFKVVQEEYMGRMAPIKYPYIEDDKLFDFLDAWRNPNNIDEDLLPLIKNAINGNLAVHEDDVCGGFTLIILDESVAKTYNANVTSLSNPISIIPIQDFKQIVEGWRDFLLGISI